MIKDANYQDVNPAFRFSLSFLKDFRLGMRFDQGNNRISKYLSEGFITRMHFFTEYLLNLSDTVSLTLGLGYNFMNNSMSPQAKIDLIRAGYSNPRETIDSVFGVFFGISVDFSQKTQWFIRYYPLHSHVNFESDALSETIDIDFSQLEIGLNIQLD